MSTTTVSAEELFASVTITDLICQPYEALKFGCPTDYAKPTTPSDWFCYYFPHEASRYGAPMLLKQTTIPDVCTKFTPLNVNIDFFASILGHQKCQQTVWHKFEMNWYRKDKLTGYFSTATDEELKVCLSQWFMKCIHDMSGTVDITPLFNEFREDSTLDRILKRAKAILAVDDAFFDPEGPNSRNPATVPQESVRLFVDQMVAAAEENVLTFHDCFLQYDQFCKANQLPGVARSQFKAAVSPHIRRRFNIGVRHDLHRYDADRCLGWRGIRVLES